MEGRIFIGIDPGASGGIAIINTFANETDVYKMPQTEHDINNILYQVGYYANHGVPAVALIEKVGSMPGQGLSSTFKFGQNYGFLRGLLVANKISFSEMIPRSWQKHLGITPRNKDTESKTEFKNRLKGLAQQYYPEKNITLATSDAILIAKVCQSINT